MGNKKSTRTARARRIATFVAAVGMLVMSSGVALLVTAPAANAVVGPNQPEYWETLEGETCAKTDTGSESGGITVPAAPDGAVWSKLIIKKGSGNIGIENQVFNNPVPGQTYTWVGFNPQQSGGWSHYILCQVPEPEPEEIAVDVVFTDPVCANQNQASYAVTGDTDDVTVESNTPAAPGANVTVTATAKDGFEFAGGETEYAESYQFPAAQSPCDIVLPPGEVTPEDPQFTDPDCGTDPAVVLPENDSVHYEVTGDLAPGGTVEVDATAIEPNVFADGATTHWEHTFPTVTDCEEVLVPETPEGAVATPTLVHAGLTDASVTNSLRGEQGLVLLVSGMVMMVIAGGLGLRTGRDSARS